MYVCRFALYEPVEFIRHFLMDKLEWSKVRDSVAIHVPCSSKKMGIESAFQQVASMCAHEVRMLSHCPLPLKPPHSAHSQTPAEPAAQLHLLLPNTKSIRCRGWHFSRSGSHDSHDPASAGRVNAVMTMVDLIRVAACR